MRDYIPDNDPDKYLWMVNFLAWMTAHGLSHGFTPVEIADLNSVVGTAGVALTNNTAQHAAARASTAAKNTAFGAALGLCRADAQRVQLDPTTTDEDRAAAGLSPRDTTGTSVPSDQVMTIAPPLLLLDFSVRRQVTIHWGINPSNEHLNRRPSGTIGCQVHAARGGIPTDESLWIPLEIDTESPLIHLISDTVPTTYAYRARYVGKNLKFGPFGDPVVCTVSV